MYNKFYPQHFLAYRESTTRIGTDVCKAAEQYHFTDKHWINRPNTTKPNAIGSYFWSPEHHYITDVERQIEKFRLSLER